MQDFVKRAIMMSAGLAAMTSEKMKEVIDELVKKGELSEKEARETLEALKEKSQRIREEWEKKIEGITDTAMKRMNIPTRKELEDLQERLERLEKSIAEKRNAAS